MDYIYRTLMQMNTKRWVSPLMMLLLGIWTNVYSTAQPMVKYLGIEYGLSNNYVTAIFQDSHGFMWFGTADGLNRYDGYQFKIYKNQPDNPASLSDNRVTDVIEDRRGMIWVATKKGVSVLNDKGSGFLHLRYAVGDKGELAPVDFAVSGMALGQQDDLFVASEQAGLLHVSSKHVLEATQIPYARANGMQLNYHIQAMDVDHNGVLWLVIHDIGLCYYDQEDGVVRLKSPYIRSVTCMKTDGGNHVWLGTDQGLYRYNIRENLYDRYTQRDGLSANVVASLSLDRDRKLWVGTDGGGITVIDDSGNFDYFAGNEHDGVLTSSAVFAIYEDAEARHWIGTLRGGINIIDPKMGRFKLVRQNGYQYTVRDNDFILSFAEDKDGTLWVGTDGSGLIHWNRHDNTFVYYKHAVDIPGSLSNNYVTSVLCDSRGDIWATTYGGGINRFDKQTGNFIRYACFNSQVNYENRNVWRIYEDSQGRLWATTLLGGGLYLLNRDQNRFELYDASIQDVLSVMEEETGVFWLGTFSDLIKLDTRVHLVSRIPMAHSVRAIHPGRNDSLWVGTEGSGLLLVDKKTGNYRQLMESDGLPSNTILNLLEDAKGNFWLSTFSGLSKFNSTTGEICNFYESDGLQSNQFNYNAALKLRSGEFLFGGIKGFNLFFPDSINHFHTVPKLVLTDLRINNKSYEWYPRVKESDNLLNINQLEVSYGDAVLSVSFSALEYSSPDKIKYAYLLEGWDKDWNYVDEQRTAHYSRLNEGNYTLRIKSTNADGEWSPYERTLSIRVLPPWWRTYWAYGIYLLLGLAGVYAYIYYDRRQTRLKYEVELAHMEVEKEKELNEKKLAFFTHISHEFRTPLTLIVNPIKELIYSENKVVDSEELSMVYRNSKRLLGLVDQLLLFRKADSGEDRLRLVRLNMVTLCREVFLSFKQHAESRKINYRFECADETLELYADREKLEIVLFNLISNAIKFTPGGGMVTVGLLSSNREVQVYVSDTGCGIPKHVGDSLFAKFYRDFEGNGKGAEGFGIGLFLAKQFVDAHGGNITYTSSESSGTRFTVTLLKGKQHFEGQYVFEDVGEHTVFLDELMPESDDAASATEEAIQNEIKDVTELVSDSPVMLVIDDNVQIRQYIQRIFNARYVVYHTGTGEEGLALVKKYQPDIVLCDVVMTGLSGIDLCTHIKQDPTLSHIPVILLTASSSEEVKLKGIECGADDYITKPFDKELLVARVSGMLKSRSQLQQYFYNEVTLRSHDFKISSEYTDFLNTCIATVEKHLDNPDFNVKILADEVGMSHSNLYRKIKSISGKSANEFIRFIRLRKVAQLLISTDCNINEAAYTAGFNDIKYFREQFFKLFGTKPSDYKKKFGDTFRRGYNVKRS